MSRRRVALALAAVSCLAVRANAADPTIVGTWEHRSASGQVLVVTFDADGTGKMNDTRMDYTVTGDRLTISVAGSAVAYSLKLDGDTLVISGGDLDAPTSFARKTPPKKVGLGGALKEAPTVESSERRTIVGEWRGKDGSVFKVEKDECSVGGKKFACTIDADALTITAVNGSKVKWPYKLDGDTLEITVGGDKQTWTRAAASSDGATTKPAKKGLAGKWRANDGTLLEFRGDGTFVYGGRTLAYTAEGGRIRMPGIEWAYKVDGDSLTLTVEGESQSLTRVPDVNDTPAARPAAPAGGDPKVEPGKGGSVVGAWDSAQGTAIFRADGSAYYNGENFTWSAEGGTLKLVQGERWVSMPFSAEKDRLVLGSGPTVTLTRAGIAGVWVGEESSVDPGNVLSFTQYLVLYKDGTVGYAKSEGYASRRQVSDCIERFMSGGEEAGDVKKTVGKWTKDGADTISIRFDWRQDALRARVDLDKMILRVDGMGRLPGNEDKPLDFKRK